MTDNAQLINTNWWDLGLPPASGFAFAVRDVWAGEDLGVFEADCPLSVKPHECRLLRLSIVPNKGARRERAALRPVRPSSRVYDIGAYKKLVNRGR